MFLSHTATELPSPSPCSTVVVSTSTQTNQCVNSEQHAVTQKEHNPVTMTTIKQCTPSHIPVVTTITQREQCAPSHIPVVTTITQREQCAPSHIPVVTTSTVNCVSVVSTITQNDHVTVIVVEMRNTSVGQTASYAGLAGGLGVLTAVMTLLLVSAVLGWVWSYHKRTRSFSIKKKL